MMRGTRQQSSLAGSDVAMGVGDLSSRIGGMRHNLPTAVVRRRTVVTAVLGAAISNFFAVCFRPVRRVGLHSMAASVVFACAIVACVPVERDPGTVVLASGARLESANPLVTIHPLSRQVQRHVLFVTLARYDSLLRPEPYFASDWSFNESRTTLDFVVHSDLRWHDGAKTTAEDVVWTINSARNPRSGYPRAADLGAVSSVHAVNDTTVRVEFDSAQPIFPLVFCELPVMPAHLLSSTPIDSMRQAPFSQDPIGNGPFRFVSRRSDGRWVFERNDDFPPSMGGPPQIRRFVIAVVDEATTKFAGLVSGELDVAGISPSMADLVARDERLAVLSYPLMFANVIVFNVHRPPFDDVRVRRAVSYALDRGRLVEAGLAGFGVPGKTLVVPDNPLALPFGGAPDAAFAAQLLDSAGWIVGAEGVRQKDGESLTFELLTVASANSEIEQLIQADLAALGIRMSIRSVEFAAFLARARENPKKFDAIVTGIPGDLSLSYLAAMFHSELSGSALDYADFHTTRLDSIFRLARSPRDTADLRMRWQDVQRELDREHPVAWLYHARGVQGLSRRLTGVTMDLRGELTSIVRWGTDGK